MSVVQARAELRDLPSNATWQERDIAFRKMFASFKKACAETRIHHQFKQHEHYEGPGEKRRRKKRESEAQRLKAMLRESFPERRKGNAKKKGKSEK